jgi:hypothetical protein
VVEIRQPSTVEHGSTRAGRWLRARRLKIALWIAVVEGLLVVVHGIPKWPSLIIAGLLVAFYVFIGRNLRSDVARNASWIAGASQAVMALIPILVTIIGTFTLIAIGALAVVALVILFSDRR